MQSLLPQDDSEIRCCLLCCFWELKTSIFNRISRRGICVQKEKLRKIKPFEDEVEDKRFYRGAFEGIPKAAYRRQSPLGEFWQLQDQCQYSPECGTPLRFCQAYKIPWWSKTNQFFVLHGLGKKAHFYPFHRKIKIGTHSFWDSLGVRSELISRLAWTFH